MEKIINLGMPHVGEQIFETLDTPQLVKCLEVSQTWKELAENVLVKDGKAKYLRPAKLEKRKLYYCFWNAVILKKMD